MFPISFWKNNEISPRNKNIAYYPLVTFKGTLMNELLKSTLYYLIPPHSLVHF